MKIVSKYQMIGDAAEIDGDRLKEICDKFATKTRATSNEDGSELGENELKGKEKMADASVDVGTTSSDENASLPCVH